MVSSRLFRSVIIVLSCALSGVAWAAPAARAAPTPAIALSPTVGPPQSTITVKGAAFGVHETVNVSFDTTARAVATSSATGTFTATVAVPLTAKPGVHTVTANGRTSGRSAHAPFTVRTNWAQFRAGPEHHGSTIENVLTTATVSRMVLKWATDLGCYVDSSPAVVNGVVYVGNGCGKFYALNAATGAPLWSAGTFTYQSDFSSPAVTNGVVYVGNANGNIYAFNAATGAKLWSYRAGQPVVSSPTVANGVVYIGSDNNHVYALNAATGAKVWSYDPGGYPVESSPAVANGLVYVASHDGTAYALKAATGAKVWSFTTGGSIISSPAVAGGVVYVSSDDEHLYALNAATGTKLWSYNGTAGQFSSPAVANGVVYIGNGGVIAINASTGKLVWRSAGGNNRGGDWVSVAVAGGVVYMADYDVYALNEWTGKLLWSYSDGTSHGFQSSPAVANGVVYIGSNYGYVNAFHLPG